MAFLMEIPFTAFSLKAYLIMFSRILLAGICGACIGIERSKRLKEAGIRTHVIICCAASLIMILSKYGFTDVEETIGTLYNGTRGTDPARLAAQVVSGVSFLGAGVIFKNGSSIKGLTTAAGMWATAAIGMAIGAGLFQLGIFTTVLLAILQFVMHRFAIGGDALSTLQVSFTIRDTEELRKELTEFFQENGVRVGDCKTIYEDGFATYSMTLRTRDENFSGLLNEFLRSKGEVKSISSTTTA